MDASLFQPGVHKLQYRGWMLAAVVGLYFTTWVNYLLFHSIIELLSIIVAATVFIITWNSLRYIRNAYLVTVGTSYLFIGALDLLHTLSYTGLGIFRDYDYYANQLWVAARYLESITLLVAFILLHAQKKARPAPLFLCFLAVTSLLVASIFYWKTFPICFIPGTGLTPFKIYSEYAICCILVASLWMLLKNRGYFSRRVHWLIAFSIVFAIVSELAFTFYISNYGFSNLVGHYFKLFSFLMIYEAIVATGIEEPYELIFKELSATNASLQKEIDLRKQTELEREQATRSLKESEQSLKELNQELEKRVEERTAELHQKDQLLLVQARQAAMGEMIGHIAHQWRQPLNTLALLVQEVQLVYEAEEISKEYLDKHVGECLQLIQHMSRTVDDFRNFFKPDKAKVPFKVCEVVDKTLSLVRGTMKEQRVEVEVLCEADPVVEGHANEFSQVVLNILVNAKDALEERRVDSPRVVVAVGQEEGRAVVTITDNAGGVPPEIIGRIFEPYFSTKEASAGTGVGLSMSKTIIEKNMGGSLSVQNVESGARFRIVV